MNQECNVEHSDPEAIGSQVSIEPAESTFGLFLPVGVVDSMYFQPPSASIRHSSFPLAAVFAKSDCIRGMTADRVHDSVDVS